jgi:hypothetical protein
MTFESRADPAGGVAEIAPLKENNAPLWARIRELEYQMPPLSSDSRRINFRVSAAVRVLVCKDRILRLVGALSCLCYFPRSYGKPAPFTSASNWATWSLWCSETAFTKLSMSRCLRRQQIGHGAMKGCCAAVSVPMVDDNGFRSFSGEYCMPLGGDDLHVMATWTVAGFPGRFRGDRNP